MKLYSWGPLQEFMDKIKDMSDEQLMESAFYEGLDLCPVTSAIFKMSAQIERELERRNLSTERLLHERAIAKSILNNTCLMRMELNRMVEYEKCMARDARKTRRYGWLW